MLTDARRLRRFVVVLVLALTSAVALVLISSRGSQSPREQLLPVIVPAPALTQSSVPQPVRPLAHVLMGASDEAAMYVAESADQARARAEMIEVLDSLIDGMTA